jgi:hypothetical protein
LGDYDDIDLIDAWFSKMSVRSRATVGEATGCRRRDATFQAGGQSVPCLWYGVCPAFHLRHQGSRLPTEQARGVFQSAEDLTRATEDQIAHHDRNPAPFIQTAKAADILAKATRARTKLDKSPTA